MKSIIFSIFFVLTSMVCFTQNKIGAGISLDFSGGYDFTETDLYKVRNDDVFSTYSTWEHNWNIGAFVKYFANKRISLVLAANTNMFGSSGVEYISPYCNLDITSGKYQTGIPFDEFGTDLLYGSHNQYYYKVNVKKYYANSFTRSNNIVAYVGFQPTNWFTIGTGLGVGFRKEIITITEQSSTKETLYWPTTKTYYSGTRVPVESIEFNTLQYYIPLILDFHMNNITGLYISTNINKDLFTTIGFRFDISSCINYE